LPSRVQRVMGAATRSKTVGAVPKILLIDRFPQQRDRSLDELIFERGCADGALAPIFLLDPDALDWRCLVASLTQTLVQIAQVLVPVFGIRRHCDPVDPRSAGLARVAVRPRTKSSSIR